MVKSCSALFCSNRDNLENRKLGLSFHAFPTDVDLRRAWAVATRRQGSEIGEVWEPPPYAYLCSTHFEPGDYEPFSAFKKKLKKGVVPSVFKIACVSPPPENKSQHRGSRTSPTQNMRSSEQKTANADCVRKGNKYLQLQPLKQCNQCIEHLLKPKIPKMPLICIGSTKDGTPLLFREEERNLQEEVDISRKHSRIKKTVLENVSCGDPNCPNNAHEKGNTSFKKEKTSFKDRTTPNDPDNIYPQLNNVSSHENVIEPLTFLQDYVRHSAYLFDATKYDCSETASAKLIKKQLHIAHQRIVLLEEYEKRLKLENKRLLNEMDTPPFIENLSLIRLDAADSDEHALILLNQIVSYVDYDT